jgi:tRNA (cmo5U34)-methyltransferase
MAADDALCRGDRGAGPSLLDAYKRDVAIISPADLEALLREAGFACPVHFSQSLLIHAWFARRAA